MARACLQDGRSTNSQSRLKMDNTRKMIKGKAKFNVRHAERWNVKLRSFIWLGEMLTPWPRRELSGEVLCWPYAPPGVKRISKKLSTRIFAKTKYPVLSKPYLSYNKILDSWQICRSYHDLKQLQVGRDPIRI